MECICLFKFLVGEVFAEYVKTIMYAAGALYRKMCKWNHKNSKNYIRINIKCINHSSDHLSLARTRLSLFLHYLLRCCCLLLLTIMLMMMMIIKCHFTFLVCTVTHTLYLRALVEKLDKPDDGTRFLHSFHLEFFNTSLKNKSSL